MRKPIDEMTTEEFDEHFDNGGDTSEAFAPDRITRPNQMKKVNVDFTVRMVNELDAEASYLGINRQAVIKTLCDEALTRRKLDRARIA